MNIALLGFGTVGRGFYELLTERPLSLNICAVLARRPLEGLNCMVTSDFYKILNEADADIIVEAMGGLEPAHEYICAALRAKKHVVTANKQLMCAYYDELTALARENGVSLRCTAAAGGGIPWLSSLARAASVDAIISVSGIMNGTSNYILDAMSRRGMDYAAALSDAQRLGYAEADPTADVCGLDTRRKLVLSANIAYGVSIIESDVPCFGIANITAEDMRFFEENGLACRLIGHAERHFGTISAAVEPMLFGADAGEARVYECGNMMSLCAAHMGGQSFLGAGAGAYPTGSNVLADCRAIAEGCSAFYTDSFTRAQVDNSRAYQRYYIRKQGCAPVITTPLSVEQAHVMCRVEGFNGFMAAIAE